MGTIQPSASTAGTDHIDAGAVIDRMREAGGFRTDIALGEFHGLGTSAVSTWRRRNTVPYAECVKIANRYGISLDWLIFGIEPRERWRGLTYVDSCGGAGEASTDPRVARMIGFLRDWQATRDTDDVAWLERSLFRAVPEYAEWMTKQVQPAKDSSPGRI